MKPPQFGTLWCLANAIWLPSADRDVRDAMARNRQAYSIPFGTGSRGQVTTILGDVRGLV